MDVSVIFATHNRADIIAEVLNAWRKTDKATKYEYEIICSDDESTDQTVSIIKASQDLPICILQNKKGGAGKARNAALKIATGKIVIFTGDDMFPEENFINLHFENHLKFGSKIAILGRIEWHNEIDVNYLMHHITNVGCEQFGFVALPPNQIIDFRHFYTSNISVAKSELDQLSYCFNEAFDKYGFEDIELGYRLQKNDLKIYYDPEILLMHHHLYKSVYKFCERQLFAGEELVVFHDLHKDLEDKCIIDIQNCRSSLAIFLSQMNWKGHFIGKTILVFLAIAKKSVTFNERILLKRNSGLLKKISSFIYAIIFRFSFYYGCSMKLSETKKCSKAQIAYFTYLYLKKGYHEIYYDIGSGFNEEEARKWICWDESEKYIEMTLPKNVKAIRVSPLKNQCIAKIHDLFFETENGTVKANIAWHNACNVDQQTYDFTNTEDPQICIDELPFHYEKIILKAQVKDMKKKNFITLMKKGAYQFAMRIKGSIQNQKEWAAYYEEGQPRKIQILISSLEKQLRDDLIVSYQNQCKILGDTVEVNNSDNRKKGFIDYFYHPKQEPLDSAQFLQAVYTLLNSNYDYLLISKSFDDFPYVACKYLDDVFIYSSLLRNDNFHSITEHTIGKFLRLPSFYIEENKILLDGIIPQLQLINEGFLTTENITLPTFKLSKRTFSFHKTKPMIFVLPIFLAVGGVERNTIEVMRALKDEYEFCMITMERHQADQGSLHYQLKDLCRYIFDLREITEFDHFLSSLFELKQMLNPDLIWVCNNSPWFEKNTSRIRSIFKDTPVVMQDVYDTKIGWIEYYSLPEVMKFDRFIAITELIKTTFMKKYSIPEEKIDVIYPVVDEKRIIEEKSSSLTYTEICEKYGIDKEKKHFSTIGRITEQKNPIRYLKMVHELSTEFPELQFIMVGDGNLNDELNDYIDKNDMHKEIIRIPYISNALEFTKILDGLIILSDYEGMPIVSIEAMSFGIPIMSTDVGDLKRFLIKSEGGIIVDEKKTDSQNFREFFHQLSKYKENAGKAANKTSEFFSASFQAQQYKKCFDKGIEMYAK